MSAAQKKLLKKKRKEARRQTSNLYEDNDEDNDEVVNRIPHQAKRALNIVNAIINQEKGKQKSNKNIGGLSSRISKAFDKGQWDEALSLLFAMRYLGQVPKLGTLQRWVANLGDNTTSDPVALGLLYAMLRVANGLGVELTTKKNKNINNSSILSKKEIINKSIDESFFENLNPKGNLVILKEWAPIPLKKNSRCMKDDDDSSSLNFHAIFSILSIIKGCDRTPPNKHDLTIYESIPNSLGFHNSSNKLNNNSLEIDIEKKKNVKMNDEIEEKESSNLSSSSSLDCNNIEKVNKIDVPFVPGAFVLTSLLSPQECKIIIQASESIGYVSDEPISNTEENNNHNDNIDSVTENKRSLVASTSAGLNDRASNFTWLADTSLIETIMSRCQHLFPLELYDKSQFVGMNARWRLYRYYPGSIYRPHVDGAWPQSGKILKYNQNNNDGSCNEYEYEYDVSKGKIRSRLTFLIYLNEGFQGGHTTYFTPNVMKEGEIYGHKISPRVGMAVLFPHGEKAGSLVHEGSNLESGVKYVLRSDALYTVPDHDDHHRSNTNKTSGDIMESNENKKIKTSR